MTPFWSKFKDRPLIELQKAETRAISSTDLPFNKALVKILHEYMYLIKFAELK